MARCVMSTVEWCHSQKALSEQHWLWKKGRQSASSWSCGECPQPCVYGAGSNAMEGDFRKALTLWGRGWTCFSCLYHLLS